MKYTSIKELAAHGSKKEIAHQLLQLNEVSNRFEEFLKERLGEEEFAEVMHDWIRYLSGETSTSIAVDYDCAGATINKLMSKHGVRKQTHEKTVRWIDKGKVWALHDAGWSTEKICEEFVAADATPEKIEEILAKPRPGRPGRKKKVVEE